ncbi:TonB-dependent receptor domain-containing protein [Flavobacterium sp. GT3R68]|uniref:TonB-dependent receptor domain-containing protein n=1 Tax=Flavobacterium sp. GT3R68 TaxID=2594437 RepID=UPI000F87324E|nr:TonB-dependent receptor [Flavobacterium sp. GT3R68]RTY93376.1 TonB-dependent receptor [Flavobacterium sp. GSN2]TRW92450.1 TonB-dependent receptor [Flavobacterium sp. GT3R68]
MKFKLMLLCLFGAILSMQAQNSAKPSLIESPGSINGKVVDKTTNEPLPYVNIIVKESDKVITGGITSDAGTFAIKNLALKNYTVEIQFIGYKTIFKNVVLTADNKTVNLNTINLEEEAVQLEGVEVVAERTSVVQKIDRKVYHIGKDIIASGTTAAAILNNIPTVSVDAQTKEISLRGNANVRVLIDGKPSNLDPAQLLEQIPSSSVKDIETITNPSSKYNPEGMSGIINIILHKSANQGFNGSLNTGITFAKTPKLNTALNLNYKVGKVNMYSNYGINHGINANHGFVFSEKPTFENHQTFTFKNKNTSHLLKLGVDYYINEKNTFSFYTIQNITDGSGNGSTPVDYFDNTTPNANNGGAPNRDSEQLFDSTSDDKSQTYDMDFKHDFKKKGENLELQANFSHSKEDENTRYDNTIFTPTTTSTNTNIVDGKTNSFQFNLDYTNPLSETAKLELGAESRIQNTKSDFQDIAPSNMTHNYFDFNRNIHAAYTNYSKQWNKWSAQIGVRLENYAIEADFEKNETNPMFNSNEKVTDNIFSFYPSAFLTYTASEKNSFNFNYSRRVDRPSIGQISPIREWTTSLMESRGNPSLKPQFTNSFEVNYTRTSALGSITAGVFYRQINDEISRVIFNDPNDPNRRILSYDNFDDNNAFGVETSANLKFTKWWSANTSVDAYFKTVKGTVQNATTDEFETGEIDVTSFNARINNTFTATKNLRFQLFGMYRGRDLSLQFERKAMYKADFGATYNVLKGKGTITARMNDVFDTMNFSFDGSNPYRQHGAFYWESQSVYVGFNLMFGGGKNKAMQRKDRDANETQGGGMF